METNNAENLTSITNSTEEESRIPKRRPFDQRALDMGLTISSNGTYIYSDQLATVSYHKLKTFDDIEIPSLAVFTRPRNANQDQPYRYNGIISDDYKFVGHETVNSSIRDSIASIGRPIFNEKTILSDFGCQMYNVISILNQNNINVKDIGDVYPTIIVTNSYNGTKAVNANFGIEIYNNGNTSLSFGFKKFGAMRQIHIQNSKTTMSSAIGEYVQSFTENIVDLIKNNFDSNVTEEQMLKALDTIEKLGKRRRDSISISIADKNSNQPITRWQLFHAITRFSSMERNLNAKLLLEDIAEKILVIPVEMERV